MRRERSEKQNAQAAAIILALVCLYFGGAYWIWGDGGMFGAVVVLMILVALFLVWAFIFLALADAPGMGKSDPPRPSNPTSKTKRRSK